MSKHTPGPWDREAIYSLLRFRSKNDGPWNDVGKEDEWMPDEDDADLIAAAPELLEALEMMLDMSEMGGFGKAAAEDVARTAIAKAKGES